MALVGHRDRHVHAVRDRGDADGRRIERMSRRIGEEIVEDLHDAPPVGHHPGQVRRQVDADGVPATPAQERVARQLDKAGHVRRLRRDRQRARFDASRIQQVADQTEHVVGLVVDDPVVLAHLCGVRHRRRVQQRGGRALDGGQRGPQLVAHHAQELRLQALQLVQGRQVLNGDNHGFDDTVRGADRRGVDQGPDAAAVGDRQHDLLAAQRLGDAQLLRRRKPVERDLPPVGKAARQGLQQSVRGLVRQGQAVDNPSRLPVERYQRSGPGVEHDDAHRGRLDQGLQVGAGSLLVLVRARVDDGRCRLRREQDEDFFVLARELLSACLPAEEEVADMLPAVTHRRRLHRPGQDHVGPASERPEVGGKVPQSHRLRKIPQVLEEPRPVLPVRESPALVRRKARADEVLDLSAFVDGRDHAVPGARQGAGAVDGLLQDGAQVEAAVDAQNGLVQPRDAISQRLVLPP